MNLATLEDRIENIRTMAADSQSLEAHEQAELDLLCLEIKGHAKLLAKHAPSLFRRLATVITDEPGHIDKSFPPEAHDAKLTTKEYLLVRSAKTVENPITDGYYHTYQITTNRAGLCVDLDGTLYRIDESGTAAVGQYAAQPGECSRDIRRDYTVIKDVGINDARAAASNLAKHISTQGIIS